MLNSRTCVVCKARESKSELFRFTCVDGVVNCEIPVKEDQSSRLETVETPQVRTQVLKVKSIGVNKIEANKIKAPKIYARGGYVHKRSSCIEQLTLKHLQYALKIKFAEEKQARLIAMQLLEWKGRLVAAARTCQAE